MKKDQNTEKGIGRRWRIISELKASETECGYKDTIIHKKLSLNLKFKQEDQKGESCIHFGSPGLKCLI